MYMNTMNSSDFTHIQNYLHTFMTGRCSFQANYQSDAALNMPQIVTSTSPRMFAHFLLGGSVMFPDTFAFYRSTKLITSPAWTGTKVVIEVEVHSTKVCQLPLAQWLPAEETGAGTLNDSTAPLGKKHSRKRRKTTAWEVINPAHISSGYLDTLYKQAIPLATPLPTVSTGTVTMMLDENCYIQHMEVWLQQRVVRAEEMAATGR
jgi:hypothetical protein